MRASLSAADVIVLERVVARAALAVRITDLATGAAVRDGISVTAWPAGPPAQPELAVTTFAVSAAGVTGFHRLPGLRRFEDGSTARRDWFASPPGHSPLPFAVRVDDNTGAHLRVVREVLAPSAAPVEIALSRSPAAATPSGWLTVTSTITTEAGAPAAWAVLELTVGGAYVTGGVADDRGVVVVPVPRAVTATSVGTPAEGPSWLVTARVRYRTADQVAVPGARPDDPPSLTSLFTQPHALVDDGGVFAASLDRSLTTRGPLVLASSVLPANPSVLVVRPTL